MRLIFLGTRGEIELRSQRHRKHSSLLVETARGRLLLDCGRDWLGELENITPDAILLTHAHEDHAGGLRAGAQCPVYATPETWERIGRYPIERRVAIALWRRRRLSGTIIEAVPVEHSLRAPAVGFRIAADGVRIFYVPDVASIPERGRSLRGVDIYIGDGASIARPILRRRNGIPIGHASIRDQLGWCAAEGVPRAVFTHCGSQVVRGDADTVEARVARLGADQGIAASIASDGLELELERASP